MLKQLQSYKRSDYLKDLGFNFHKPSLLEPKRSLFPFASSLSSYERALIQTEKEYKNVGLFGKKEVEIFKAYIMFTVNGSELEEIVSKNELTTMAQEILFGVQNDKQKKTEDLNGDFICFNADYLDMLKMVGEITLFCKPIFKPKEILLDRFKSLNETIFKIKECETIMGSFLKLEDDYSASVSVFYEDKSDIVFLIERMTPNNKITVVVF